MHHCNGHRPHQGIGGDTPMSRIKTSRNSHLTLHTWRLAGNWSVNEAVQAAAAGTSHRIRATLTASLITRQANIA